MARKNFIYCYFTTYFKIKDLKLTYLLNYNYGYSQSDLLELHRLIFSHFVLVNLFKLTFLLWRQ